MISRFNLIRNVGTFDSFSGDARTNFSQFTCIYGENGRGKTTLAAIFRSLATGGPLQIVERHRFGSTHPPHVVVLESDPSISLVFENGAWSQTFPQLLVFDDRFVDDNVYSGLDVGPDHRQNMHGLILGEQGVTLNRDLQALVGRIEEHNRELRNRAALIQGVSGGLAVEAFCSLTERPSIDRDISEAERNLAAVTEAGVIQEAPLLDSLSLPQFDLDGFGKLLARSIDDLDKNALAKVQAHIGSIGPGGERWLEEGVRRADTPNGTHQGSCPFCNQPLEAIELFTAYRSYFGEQYAKLLSDIDSASDALTAQLGERRLLAVERSVQLNSERIVFWQRFCDLPSLDLSAASPGEEWPRLYAALSELLSKKRESPLEKGLVSDRALGAARDFDDLSRRISDLNSSIAQANTIIATAKERARSGDRAAIQGDIARLRTIQLRFQEPAAGLCEAFAEEGRAKAETERRREGARRALDNYRNTVFPAYETAVNLYLQRFGAGFRLDSVSSTNNRSGSACTYNVIINERAIPVGRAAQPGQPSFRNTLSTGDRTTLALAFFFASLDRRTDLASCVVVVDDPIASMDSNRTLTTVQEMRGLAGRVAQLVLMSHDKAFLVEAWSGADRSRKAAVEVARYGSGSTIRKWDVTRDAITEHDRRHQLLREHLEQPNSNPRLVAESLRMVLEAFLRVAYPDHFNPGETLEAFVRTVAPLVGGADEVLNAVDLQELRHLKEYANRFHHDSNPACATVTINDGELVNFIERTIRFARRQR